MNINKRLRSTRVLHRAWAQVRASGLSSTSEKTKLQIEQFEANWFGELESIKKRLRDQKFEFAGEKGITPPKGKGKPGVRPIVIAPVANRIVRRAILEVLQGYGEPTDDRRRRWDGVSKIREIMATRTSVGGIKSRGVPHGLALINQAVRDGKHFFIRSDIKDFFTRIPRGDVNTFIDNAVGDPVFVQLFKKALETNLENQEELEERRLYALFPDQRIGVAQGSALSALAGNIALREFDVKLNGRDIVCVRYIDDFILLGPSARKVRAAYMAARSMLQGMTMDVYDVADVDACKSGKVDSGNIHDGTDFLGYRISGEAYQPCAAATKKFLSKMDKAVDDCMRSMKKAAAGEHKSHATLYHQSMVLIHEIIWGWSQAFRHTTATHVFQQLDRDVDKRLIALGDEFKKIASGGDATRIRRISGVHMLADTKLSPLPET